jgi:TonB family protein
MTPSLRSLLFIAISVAFLHSNVSTAETPPPGVYVEVEIEYDTGKVTDVRLNKSTGDPKLDVATIEKFRKWRFKPKKVRRVEIPIRFATDKK